MVQERYNVDNLPIHENLENFAAPYTPESFTPEEQSYLKPFFTNIDKPVFCIHGLPQSVAAALCSRYSRTTDGLRRVFLREYVQPILNPEQSKDWQEIQDEEKQKRLETKQMFRDFIENYDTAPDINRIANTERAHAFFKKWLSEYGDDSIAELGGVHICMEGISSLAIEEIVDQRIGLSPLIKSSRYVFSGQRRPDGEYQFVVPGELKGTSLEQDYIAFMRDSFALYEEISDPYFKYIQTLYTRITDGEKKESETAYNSTCSAKRFDDIRDLLNFATQNNIAIFSNGRSIENMLNRLFASPLGEVRWVGQQALVELDKVIPSFVERPKSARGAEIQKYKGNLGETVKDIADNVLRDIESKGPKKGKWAELITYTPNADVEILSALIFEGSEKTSFVDVRERVKALSQKERQTIWDKIFGERKFGRETMERFRDRFKKVHRAFENATYLFSFFARGGDYRDLHRHRMAEQNRMMLTTYWGYDLEPEVMNSPFSSRIQSILHRADQLYQRISKEVSSDVAQYVIPFAYLQHWYMGLTAREIYWTIELRTGPQGRPHYREVCQQIAEQVKAVTSGIFDGLLVDNNTYTMSRREANIKKESKK